MNSKCLMGRESMIKINKKFYYWNANTEKDTFAVVNLVIDPQPDFFSKNIKNEMRKLPNQRLLYAV